VICPLCSQAADRLLSESLRSGPGKVHFCPGCDLAFLDPASLPDPESYYATRYRQEHGPVIGKVSDAAEVFAAHVGYQQARLDLLSPHLTTAAELLEIGCSCGQFLHHAIGRAGRVAGIDYNPDHTAFARDRLGCDIFAGPPEKAPFAPASFDIVCAFQTLEHAPDPVAFIGTMARFLKPGGLLVLEVPNLYDPLRSVYDCEAYRSFYFHEAHLFYFSGRSLAATAARAGFAGTLHYVQDYNLTNHLHWVHRNAPQPNCHLGLGEARLPLSPACPPEAEAALDAWAQEAGRSYKTVLADLGLTDNVTFLGRRRAEA